MSLGSNPKTYQHKKLFLTYMNPILFRNTWQ